MKQITILFTLFFILFWKSIYAQCEMQWGPWSQALNTQHGAVSYQVQYSKCTSDGICGWPKVAILHSFPADAFVSIKLHGVDCDGKERTSGFNTSQNCSPHQEYLNAGNWHLFKKVYEVVYVKAEFKYNGKQYTVLYDKARGINKIDQMDISRISTPNAPQNTNFNNSQQKKLQGYANEIIQLQQYQQAINQLKTNDNSQEIIDMGTLLGNSVQELIKVLAKEEEEEE